MRSTTQPNISGNNLPVDTQFREMPHESPKVHIFPTLNFAQQTVTDDVDRETFYAKTRENREI